MVFVECLCLACKTQAQTCDIICISIYFSTKCRLGLLELVSEILNLLESPETNSSMAKKSQVPSSTPAIPPAINNNEDLPPRKPASLSGTTANPSSAGGVSVTATGSTPDAPKATINATPSHHCANCGAHTTVCCSGCGEGLDGNGDPSSTYYCSGTCQIAHWKTHKDQCKLSIDRRQLYRIGSLVRHAFYVGTKTMWYDEIVEVRKIDPVAEKRNAVVRGVQHPVGNHDTEGKEVESEHAVGDDSLEMRARRNSGVEDDAVKVRVRKTKRVAWEDGVEVHLRRYKRHDGPDFPGFATGDIPGYGGVLEERDEQSVLAASASNAAIVCALLEKLVTGEYTWTV
jgi:hypothetical protein